MNSQDFRSIQEAYMEVYNELDEGENPLPYGRMMKKSDELASTDDKTKQKRAAKIYIAANTPTGPKVKVKKEEVDIYDIILSHLLDEGYAETQEQAEVIMVNMSEEWRESICEAILEYQPFKDKRKRVKSKVKKLESEKSGDPKDLGFRNARLQKRIDSMKTVLGKKNKEITSASQQKSYDSMAKGGFKHHDDPQSKYYIK